MGVPYPIHRLWALVEREGIEVVWYPDETYPRGRYCIANNCPFIFLNPFVQSTTMRLRTTLAHELGHHFAGFGSGGDTRDDERAMRWAYELVLPYWWIRKRLDWEPWRIAEEADVYQEWVVARLKMIWQEHHVTTPHRRKAMLAL